MNPSRPRRPRLGETLRNLWGPFLWAALAGSGCGSPGVDEQGNPGEVCVVTLALAQAAGDVASRHQPLVPEDVTITSVGPDRLFPGGRIVLQGTHLGGEEGETPRLRLQGWFQGEGGGVTEVSGELGGVVADAGRRAEFPLSPALLESWGLGGGAGSFDGTALLLVQVGEPLRASEVPCSLHFELVQQLRPTLAGLSLDQDPDQPLDVFPEDSLVLVATDLLLRGEGVVELVIDGDAQRGAGASRPVSYVLPVAADSRRDEGVVGFPASAFGILPGTVQGEAHLRATTGEGQTWESERVPVRLQVLPPVIAALDPPAASRGQWVDVHGRGFLPATARGGTLLRLDGRFQPRGEAASVDLSAYELLPEESVGNGKVRIPFRTETVVLAGQKKSLTGLTATPGVFSGTITPIISWDDQEVVGIPYTDGFQIAPTKQVVYIKYLPGFTISLNSTWGMKNVEREVRQQILSVVNRDYSGINVVFTEERPRDFVEYLVIEVGGLDPNGHDLFGLDNTSGEEGDSPKDVMNLRLQEVIGGKNARAEESGYLAYGGVFLESFRQFSTLLPEPIGLASTRFEDVFEGIAPFLCGQAIEVDEYPDGPRAAEIAEAIRVLGNLIGSTLTHEVGHSLGLSLPYGAPTEFHNLMDLPNAIMDAGSQRPFEERAELDGQGPAVFNAENRAYLEEILPLR